MRYKVAYGGRGSAKSWSVAKALLLLGIDSTPLFAIQRPLRILCTREVQESIELSVHKLLSDQIKRMNIESLYTVQAKRIFNSLGSEFYFRGLSDLTVDSIKSFEDFDIVWIEEAHTISTRSINTLDPTIRKAGSEIWMTLNPELETDPIYHKFVLNPPDNCASMLINWRDNKWFPEVLDKQRLYDKEHNQDIYEHKWEGKCLPAIEGAIYFKRIQELERQGRVLNIPYDPMLKVHIVADIGRDAISLGLVQKLLSEIRVIEAIECSHTDWSAVSAELRTRQYNWGKFFLPHDGFAKKLESDGKSSYDILKAQGWDVVSKEETVIIGREEGIKVVLLTFHQLYFDQTKTAADTPTPARTPDFHATDLSGRLMEALKRYRRHINKQTGAIGDPVHDQYSHGADLLRYLVLNIDKMINEEVNITKNMFKLPSVNQSNSSWMGL